MQIPISIMVKKDYLHFSLMLLPKPVRPVNNNEKKPKPGKTGDKKKWIKTQIAVNSRSIALARLLF